MIGDIVNGRDQDLAPGEGYVTTFCNKLHVLKTGRPVGHECYVLSPRKLQLETDDRIDEIVGSMTLPTLREDRSKTFRTPPHHRR